MINVLFSFFVIITIIRFFDLFFNYLAFKIEKKEIINSENELIQLLKFFFLLLVYYAPKILISIAYILLFLNVGINQNYLFLSYILFCYHIFISCFLNYYLCNISIYDKYKRKTNEIQFLNYFDNDLEHTFNFNNNFMLFRFFTLITLLNLLIAFDLFDFSNERLETFKNILRFNLLDPMFLIIDKYNFSKIELIFTFFVLLLLSFILVYFFNKNNDKILKQKIESVKSDQLKKNTTVILNNLINKDK